MVGKEEERSEGRRKNGGKEERSEEERKNRRHKTTGTDPWMCDTVQVVGEEGASG